MEQNNPSHLKDVAYALEIIDAMERETRSKAARRLVTELAAGPLGPYTDEAKRVWRAYYQYLS